MNEPTTLSRRDFLKAGGVGVGLVLAFPIPVAVRAKMIESGAFQPSGWIRIGTDGLVTLTVDKSEMGQGVLTSMRMILADELEAEWEAIQIGSVPEDPSVWPRGMMTAGSSSIRGTWDALRGAGAAAREMLITAAAQSWEVDRATCKARNSVVIHEPSGRELHYGKLSEAAAGLPVPTNPRLKAPDEFRLIGQRVPRLDTPEKVNGRAIYGIDVRIPGMLIATVARSPVFRGKVRRFDDRRARAIPGVRHVVELRPYPDGSHAVDPVWGEDPWMESGVAVVADRYWQAVKGREVLEIEWDEGPNADLSSASITEHFRDLADNMAGIVVRNEENAPDSIPVETLEATYETPYLHHATMEPLNCTAHVRGDHCDVWVGTQAQTSTQKAAARFAGVPVENVRVHTTFLGGGFGRRTESDFVAEAVQISRAIDAPVKVIWTRADDVQHGFYRPATYHRFRGGLDADRRPLSWKHKIVAPSLVGFKNDDRNIEIDFTSVEGARNLPYAIDNLRIELVNADVPVPLGWWRSVGSSQNAFVTESFIDELAIATGSDPFEFRRQLLTHHPRHRRVLEIAAERAEWGQPLAAGRARGIAVAEAFGSFVAEVAEVSVDDEGRVRVRRVTCVVDCGQVVNPDTVEAQMEGGIVYGLSAALYGEITLERGRVQQSNFHDYPALRIGEMPQVETYIVPSSEPPGGVGEPSVPPIAPAVCNALHALTGQRIRSLPIGRVIGAGKKASR